MNIEDNVPFSLDEISAQWLQYALASNGWLESGSVTDISMQQIGEDAGFLGQIAILTPHYSDGAVTREGRSPPVSLVVKIPTPEKSRVFGQTMGVYEREIRFYAELKDTVGINAPVHYYSAASDADEPHVVTRRLENFDSYPMWLMPLVGLIGLFRFGRKARRYILLIEDISYLRLGDQFEGCSNEDLRRVLGEMAKLHASYWGSETAREDIPWIGTLYGSAKLLHLWFLGSIRRYRKETKSKLNPRQLELVDWVHKHGVQLSRVLGSQPRTLGHHDLRLDNVAFNDETGEAMLFDWQTITFCSPGLDLAYFLSSAISEDFEESKVGELLAYYHEQMRDHGVDISAEYLRWIYEVGMLALLHRIISVLYQGQIELGDGRGPAVMQQWVRVIHRRLEYVEFEGIFERMPHAQAVAD